MEVVIFTSTTCAPCRQVKPLVMNLQDQYKFRLRLIEACKETQYEFQRHNITSVPVIAVLDDNGNLVGDTLRGPKPASEIAAFLRKKKVIPQ